MSVDIGGFPIVDAQPAAFPALAVTLEAFPGPDAGTARFPGPDAGFAEFPPSPVMLLVAAPGLTLTPAAVVAVVPWRTADAAFTLPPAVLVSVAVQLDAAPSLTMSPVGSIVPDELLPGAAFTMSPTAEITHAAVLEAAAGLTMAAGMASRPVAVVTADAITALTVSATVAVAGIITAPVVFAVSPAAAPVVPAVDVTAEPGLAMSPTALVEVVTFEPSRMTMVTDSAGITSTSMVKVTGWGAAAGSTVTDNELVVNGDEPAATVEAAVTWTNTGFITRTVTMRLMHEDTEIDSASISVARSATELLSLAVPGRAVADLETVWVEASINASGTMVAPADPTSYVRVHVPD